MNVLVTGGASGVGAALVGKMQQHTVWVLDVKPPLNLADNHQYLQLDLSDKASIDSVVEQLPESIDRLANVAGIATAAEPETVLAVNFLGLRYLTESVQPRLATGGRIVSVSSVAGRDWRSRYEKLLPLLVSSSFDDGMTWCEENREKYAKDPYTFSKRLVTAYTLRSAETALKSGYRINCISPGPIETPLYPAFEALMGKAQSDWMKAQTGRAASPVDIAEVIAMLLTGDCDWLNGVDIPVDGGYTAGTESGWIDFSSSPIMQR